MVKSLELHGGAAAVYDLVAEETIILFLRPVFWRNACTFCGINGWLATHGRTFKSVGRNSVNVRNREVFEFLRGIKPGQWTKVYVYGADGSEIHFFEHSSGETFDPK